MKTITMSVLTAVALSACAGVAQAGWPGDSFVKCPPDAVKVGSACVDTYEASVWDIPANNLSGRSNAALIRKVKNGKASLADLTAGGATQVSPSSGCTPVFPGTFPADGNWTAPLYAVSVAGVNPTACTTWFQAAQACRQSGKRLLTNAEWQDAASGTPDPGVGGDGTTTCNTFTADVVNTGSTGNCKSNYGAFDMVGNVWEWVADWVPRSTACGSWSFATGDYQCLGGAATTGEPGALIRGGDWGSGAFAGVFAVYGSNQPSLSASSSGSGARASRRAIWEFGNLILGFPRVARA